MTRRGNAVHVVTTKRHYKGRTYRTHLLRRSYREGGKVKNETLGNLSHLPDAVVELIRRALRGEQLMPAEAVFEISRARPHGHVAAVLGMMDKLGLKRLLAARGGAERDRCLALIAARVIAPGSKLATARALDPESATSSLGETLGLGAVSAEDLYGAMDWLVARQGRIEQALARRHLQDATLVLYDVSSSYLTGQHCDLAAYGYSRDGKPGTLQIVYGLLCTAEGCPVAVEVFEGDTADPNTLSDQIAKLKQRFGLKRVVLVGDRGMITSARIREELQPAGLDWITALRAPAIAKLAADGPLQPSLFDERDLAEIAAPEHFPGERLVVCRNPDLAAERARKREDLLAATERELDKIVAATTRARRPLRGQDRIGLRVGKLLDRFHMAKHFEITITQDTLQYARKQDSIAAEARLDGIYVLRTNLPADRLSAEQAVGAYKNLAAVERAFRCLKTVDLEIRPVHHRRAERVRAHVLLCMLAYYVEWHMRQALAPLLFGEEDPAAERGRTSPVQPATPSEATTRKAATRRSRDAQPVHDFRGLIAHLATLTKNTIQPKESQASFEQLSVPTPLQRRAFELLEVPLKP